MLPQLSFNAALLALLADAWQAGDGPAVQSALALAGSYSDDSPDAFTSCGERDNGAHPRGCYYCRIAVGL